MPDVILIGDINVDVNLTVPAYPRPGSEAVASGFQIHTGGSAVNTAIALAKMDMDVGLIGRIGRDVLAQQALDDLQRAGVDCSQIQADGSVRTGLIFIVVTQDGERTMFGARGANVFTDATAIDPNYFTDCRWIHLSGYSFLSYQQHEVILKALSLAENSRYTRVSLDPGTDPIVKARHDILEVLPRIDVIFPNETELALFGGGRSEDESINYLLESGVKAVVNKRGRHGSVLAIGNRRVQLPAFSLKTRDTTGAGDSFNAGVVLGRLVGLTWEASVALGNALGGLATTHEGAGATLVNRHIVAKLVEDNLFTDEWEQGRLALEELATYFEGPL